MNKPTTYDVLCELERMGMLEKSLQAEVVSITLAFQKHVYEVYKKYCLEFKSDESALRTSVDCDMTKRAVWYIIRKMES